jgi:hypothetical protein
MAAFDATVAYEFAAALTERLDAIEFERLMTNGHGSADESERIRQEHDLLVDRLTARTLVRFAGIYNPTALQTLRAQRDFEKLREKYPEAARSGS